MPEPTTIELPEGFCEHSVDECPFCGRNVHCGHTDTEQMLLHVKPQCEEFKVCDTPKEFALLSLLKIKSDMGLLERN